MKFDEAIYLSDLIWYDGPVLSLYQQNGKKYLVLWVDVLGEFPDEEHVWYVIEVDEPTLRSFYDKHVSLREVMECSPAIYEGRNIFMDEGTECPLVPWADIPDDRKPSAESFHDETLGRDAA